MAAGDNAAAAGYTVYPATPTLANRIAELIARVQDDLADKTGNKSAPVPVSKGGTGGATAEAARAALGLVKTLTSADSEGKIPAYNAAGQLPTGSPASSGQAANKGYVDEAVGDRVAKTGDTITGQLRLPNADTVSSSYVGLYFETSGGKICRGSSSRRYKQHIRDADPNLFAGVLDLRERVFERRKKGNFSEVGLIAEEVVEVVPWLVVHDEQGRPDAVNYEHLALALLPVVRDLAARVEQIERGNER